MIALELALVAAACLGVLVLREHLARELGLKRAEIAVRTEHQRYHQLRRAEEALRRCG